MGSEGSSGCFHINTVQKTFMGWLDGCNVVEATDDGTFNLSPIELPCNGPQALKFPAFDGRWYWLEYRAELGEFHTNLDEGILVRVAADTTGAPRPYFLDMGQGDFLFEGDSYTDPQGVVTFTALEFHGTHAVVQASFGDPSGQAPACLDGSDPGMDEGHVGQKDCAEEVYAGDTSPPEITVTFPEDGQWFEPGSDFKIIADATDDRAIVSVELFLDNEPLLRKIEPPWEWDVNNIPAGDYSIGAVARDSRHYTNSNAVEFHVGTPPPPGDESGESTGDPATTTDAPSTTDSAVSDSDSDGSDTDGAPETTTDDAGCGCTHAPGHGAPLLTLALFGLLRRRRWSEPPDA
jgi:MYXO-CTERM domain-containing protein